MDPDGRSGRPPPRRSPTTFKDERPALHAHHQHARQGQGDLRPLARLQGRRRLPASGQPRRARGGRCAGRRGARRLSAPVASLLRDEGEVARHGQARALGPQRAAARTSRARVSPGTRRSETVLDAYGGFAPEMAAIAETLLRRALDRRAGARRARRRAPSRIRRCRRRTPTCCSTTWASRAT